MAHLFFFFWIHGRSLVTFLHLHLGLASWVTYSCWDLLSESGTRKREFQCTYTLGAQFWSFIFFCTMN